MKTKKILCVLLAAVFLFASSACSKQSPPKDTGSVESTSAETKNTEEEGKYIYFGAIAALSGDNSLIGQYMTEGGDLFEKNVNEAGGVLGKQVKIIYEDEGASDQGSINAAMKLVSRGDITAIVGSFVSSSNNIAVMPTMEEYTTPLFAGGSSANIKNEHNPYAYMCRLSDDLTGATMSKAAVDVLGMSKIAVIHGSDSFGAGLAEQVTNNLKEQYEIEPALDITFNPGEVQYTPFLTQIVNADVDGIIAIAHQNDAGIMMKQAGEMGIEIPRLGNTSFCSEVALTGAGEAAVGWYSIGDWTNDVKSDTGKAFVEQYREAYGHDPDMPSVFLYDSLTCVVEAIRLANSTDPVKVNEAMKQIKDVVGVASVYSADPEGVLGSSQFVVVNEADGPRMIESVLRDR